MHRRCLGSLSCRYFVCTNVCHSISKGLNAAASILTKIHLSKYNLPMSAIYTSQLVTTQCYEFVRPSILNLQSMGYTQSDSRMILSFQAGRCSLADGEIATLQRWINSWNRPGSEKHLMIGGAYETPRPSRLRRLHYLMVVIEELGVPRSRFYADEDWTRFTGVRLTEAAPADVVWLQLRSFPTSYVKTLAAPDTGLVHDNSL